MNLVLDKATYELAVEEALKPEAVVRVRIIGVVADYDAPTGVITLVGLNDRIRIRNEAFHISLDACHYLTNNEFPRLSSGTPISVWVSVFASSTVVQRLEPINDTHCLVGQSKHILDQLAQMRDIDHTSSTR